MLQLIVREALEQSDNKFAYKHCKNLMEKGYPDIWTECYQLASSSRFSDIEARWVLGTINIQLGAEKKSGKPNENNIMQFFAYVYIYTYLYYCSVEPSGFARQTSHTALSQPARPSSRP